MFQRILKVSAWSFLAFIVFSTVSPIDLRPHDVLPVNLDRALAFAVLAFLFSASYPRHIVLCALVILLGAFAMEALQFLEPSRHPRLIDAVVKASGALVGLMIGRVASRFHQKLSVPSQ